MPFRISKQRSSSKPDKAVKPPLPPPGSFRTSEKKDGNNTSWTHSESSFEGGERIPPLRSLETPPRPPDQSDDVSSIHVGESVSNGLRPRPYSERLSSNYRNPSSTRRDSSQEVDILLGTLSLAEREATARSSSTGKDPKEKKQKGMWRNQAKKQSRKQQPKGREQEREEPILCEFRAHDADEESELLIRSLSNPSMSPPTALVTSAVGLSLLTASEGASNHSPYHMVRESVDRHIYVCMVHEQEPQTTSTACTDTKSLSLPVDVDDVSFVKRDRQTVQDVALMHISEGEPQKALEIFRVLLHNQRQERWNKHHDAEELESRMATTKSILTLLSLLTDHTRDAWQYATSALQAHKRAGRPVHLTLSHMELGLCYFAGGKLTKALQCWREALQLACMTLGYDNIQVAILLGNLGCLHYYMGNHSASLKALEESLGLHRQALRSDSQCAHVEMPLFQMASTMANLAVVLAHCKNYEPASSLMEESVAIQESVLSRSGSVARVSEKYLDMYMELRDAKELDLNNDNAGGNNERSANGSSQSVFVSNILVQPASSIFGDTDGIPRRHDGSRHHQVSPCLGANTFEDYPFYECILLGSLVKPATARERVHATLIQSIESAVWRQPIVMRFPDEETLTPHSTTFMPRKKQPIPVDLDGEAVIDAEQILGEINLQALFHLERKEFKDALDLFESALRSHKVKYGDIHHLVGTGLHNCGIVHMLAEQYIQGKMCFQEAVSVRAAALGESHPDVAASKFKIGMTQMAGGDFECALATFIDVISQLQMNMSTYGFAPEGRMLNSIGVVLYELRRNHDAFQSFYKAYQIQKGLTSDQNCGPAAERSLAHTLSNLGFIYAEQGQYYESLDAYNEALEILKKSYSSDHSLVVTLEENLAHVRAYGASEGQEKSSVKHAQSEIFASCSRLENQRGNRKLEHGQSKVGACFRLQ